MTSSGFFSPFLALEVRGMLLVPKMGEVTKSARLITALPITLSPFDFTFSYQKTRNQRKHPKEEVEEEEEERR